MIPQNFQSFWSQEFSETPGYETAHLIMHGALVWQSTICLSATARSTLNINMTEEDTRSVQEVENKIVGINYIFTYSGVISMHRL